MVCCLKSKRFPQVEPIHRKLVNLHHLFHAHNHLPSLRHLVHPKRTLVRQGCLHKLTRNGPQPRMFFLFSDVLIYTGSSLISFSFISQCNIFSLAKCFHLFLLLDGFPNLQTQVSLKRFNWKYALPHGILNFTVLNFRYENLRSKVNREFFTMVELIIHWYRTIFTKKEVFRRKGVLESIAKECGIQSEIERIK